METFPNQPVYINTVGSKLVISQRGWLCFRGAQRQMKSENGTERSLFAVSSCHHSLSPQQRTPARLPGLGGRPELVPVPARKQLIMCERLSERLLSGQQQHSTIYPPAPPPRAPRPARRHAVAYACTHTHTCGSAVMADVHRQASS